MTDELTRYLRENRERYTREALTDHLVAEGHDRGSVEAAWARLEAERRAASPPTRAVLGPARGLPAILVMMAYVLAIGAGILGAVVAAGSSEVRSAAVLGIYVVAMIVAMIFSFRRMTQAPAGGGGLTAFLAGLAIGIFAFVGLSGLCVAGLNVATT